MQERKDFNHDKLRRIDWRPGGRFSDKFSDEDQALRRASIKVGKFVMPERKS